MANSSDNIHGKKHRFPNSKVARISGELWREYILPPTEETPRAMFANKLRSVEIIFRIIAPVPQRPLTLVTLKRNLLCIALDTDAYYCDLNKFRGYPQAEIIYLWIIESLLFLRRKPPRRVSPSLFHSRPRSLIGQDEIFRPVKKIFIRISKLGKLQLIINKYL